MFRSRQGPTRRGGDTGSVLAVGLGMLPDAAVRFLAAALAVALAISLTFASIELPKIANGALAEVFDAHGEPARDATEHLDLFPGVDSGRNPEVTDAFFRRYHVRPIGRTSIPDL